MKIYVINGPNLNMLGTREPEIYGKTSFENLLAEIHEKCHALGAECECFHSNHEGGIIDKLHNIHADTMSGRVNDIAGIILNAGAFTHYSYAIRDAVSAIEIPVIEVHISNVHKREEFRHKSVISAVCEGVLCGFGTAGYLMAAEYLISTRTKR